MSSIESHLSNKPKQVFFNPINIFDTFTHSITLAQRLTVRQKEYYEETKRHAQLKVCVVYYRIRWMRAALNVWKSGHLRSQKIQHLRRKSIRLLSKRLEKFAFDYWRRKSKYSSEGAAREWSTVVIVLVIFIS